MSDEVENEKLCQRWIVEYYCWRMLKVFCKSGTVDEGFTRHEWRLHWHENPDNFGDRTTHGCRLLMHFVCKIVEAGKGMSEEVPAENQHDRGTLERTVMEEALDLLDYISNAFTRLEDAELAEVQLCLRRYAVLIPLYKDDRVTAKVQQFGNLHITVE